MNQNRINKNIIQWKIRVHTKSKCAATCNNAQTVVAVCGLAAGRRCTQQCRLTIPWRAFIVHLIICRVGAVGTGGAPRVYTQRTSFITR